MDAVEAFRKRALNPEHRYDARLRTRTATSSSSTARLATSYYEAVPGIVEEYMGKVNAKLGTNYQLFNYYGAA